jgi:hypothetical protein
MSKGSISKKKIRRLKKVIRKNEKGEEEDYEVGLNGVRIYNNIFYREMLWM